MSGRYVVEREHEHRDPHDHEDVVDQQEVLHQQLRAHAVQRYQLQLVLLRLRLLLHLRLLRCESRLLRRGRLLGDFSRRSAQARLLRGQRCDLYSDDRLHGVRLEAFGVHARE